MTKGQTLFGELARTVNSLVAAGRDWLVLRSTSSAIMRRDQTFAFLVHPRTEKFTGTDVYGNNDIYRPFPALRHLFHMLPYRVAEKLLLWFAKTITPIMLSRIQVQSGDSTFKGYLLSTVRTPRLLLTGERNETRAHLAELFALATKMGVRRVGLGALLPSMTGYGKRFAMGDPNERPAVSTGHAYTAYTIAEYLKLLVEKRHPDAQLVRTAIVGAGGSTGKALMRVLKRTWVGPAHLELMLVDIPGKEMSLRALANEAIASGRFASVRIATDLSALHESAYVAVVTNASGTIIKPEHLSEGTVVIDDSQPRNTSTELAKHGVHVIDVLARVPGLNCNFDFGFQTEDPTVTFTCLAETILATIAGEPTDLAVGEVTDDVVERTLNIVAHGRKLGLIGELPFFSFGRELSATECEAILVPIQIPYAPAAE